MNRYRELLQRYDKPGPRYTSYPTAPCWSDDFAAEDYATRLAVPNDEPLSLYVHIPYCNAMCFFCGCSTVITQRHEAITTLTIDRAHARNAVDPETAQALYEAFLAFEADDNQLVAILTGAGGYFCAGFDLKAAGSGAADDWIKSLDIPQDWTDPITQPRAGPMGPTRLMLATYPAQEPQGPMAFLSRLRERRGGGALSLYLTVPDAAAELARCEGAGAQVVEPLWDPWWGGRELTVEDPDGHWWTLYQRALPDT